MKKIFFHTLFFMCLCCFCNNTFAQDTLYQSIVTSPADDLSSGDSKVYLSDGAFLLGDNELLSGASGHYYAEHDFGILFSNGLYAASGSELFAITIEDINLTISNKDLAFEGYFKLMTNPTTEYVQGEYELENSGNVSFRIFNTLGVEVLTPQLGIITSEGRHQFEFNIESFAAGTYFLVFYFNDKIHLEKVVKL